MSTNPALAPSRRETEAERASRVRDNKRRHRARQKEYVVDLERKVAESREQGIQATKEVQLAAQRVARENAKLRELLSSIGYTNAAIDAWVRGDEAVQDGEHSQFRLEARSKKQSTCESQPAKPDVSRNEGELGPMEASGPAEERLPNPSPPPAALPPPPPPSAAVNVSPPKECTGTCAKSGSQSASEQPEIAVAPCQLLTLLAKNPAADITQVPLPEPENQACKDANCEDPNSDGVECAAAYKMLIHYATSDEKMDKIAAALESGCTPTAGGGCKVKKSVVWKALDENCI
jgi:hypothetical protein